MLLKKLLLLITFIFVSIYIICDEIDAKMGFTYPLSVIAKTSTGVSKRKIKGLDGIFAGDIYKSLTDTSSIGIGAEYEKNMYVEEPDENGNLRFTDSHANFPVYLVYKQVFKNIFMNKNFYALGRIGYNKPFSMVSGYRYTGGYYWAVGGGLEEDSMIAEIVFCNSQVRGLEDIAGTYDYSRVSFMVGWRFTGALF